MYSNKIINIVVGKCVVYKSDNYMTLILESIMYGGSELHPPVKVQ